MRDHGCALTPLSASDAGSVTLCPDCGVLHLQMQYLTLRFDTDAFRELTQLLAKAQARLDRMAPEPASAATPVRRGLH